MVMPVYTKKERSLPVVLMVEKNMAGERRALAEWLESSRFLACDATDVFDAIEELADFTVRDRPDIIVLDVDCCSENADLIRTIFTSGKNEPPILTFSSDAGRSKNCPDLPALSDRLNSLIPEQLHSH
jgi:DNA-binding response OmpR family regulator